MFYSKRGEEMNRFLPNFKSQILQVMRAPKDKRLLKHFYDSLDRFKSIEETDFWESFYELTHSRKWNFPQICDEYVLGNFFRDNAARLVIKWKFYFLVIFNMKLDGGLPVFNYVQNN